MGIALVPGQTASNINSAGASSTLTVTLPNNPRPGGLVVVGYAIPATVTSVTVADGNSNSYTATSKTLYNGATARCGILYLQNVPTNGNKTLTLTANQSITQNNFCGWAAEFSGALTSGVFENDATADGTGTAITTPSYTSTNDNDLYFAVCGANGTISTANSPWTGIDVIRNGNWAEYFIQGAKGARAVDYTQSPSTTWSGIVAAFKAAYIPPRRQQIYQYPDPPYAQQARSYLRSEAGTPAQTVDNPPRWRQQQAYPIIDLLNAQQRRPSLLGTTPAAMPPIRQQQIYQYPEVVYSQQQRDLSPALIADVVAVTPDNPPGLREQQPYLYPDPPYAQQLRRSLLGTEPAAVPETRPQQFYPYPDPLNAQQAQAKIVQPGAAAATPDNPPLTRPQQVYPYQDLLNAQQAQIKIVQTPVVATPDNPPAPRVTVYWSWLQPDPLAQQSIVRLREEPGTPAQQVDTPPPLVRQLSFWQLPDPIVQQAQIRIIPPGPAVVQPPAEEPVGVGGFWVPHHFTRKRCKELLDEIAKERAAAQALAAAPKKAVLAAANVAAEAVRDACDLCPAEASGEFYAEARAVVEALRRTVEADLAAKAIIAEAREVQRRAEMLIRAAEEADEDDAISVLLMGM